MDTVSITSDSTVLPDWAWAAMTVSAQGKVTGKIAMAGTNYSFSAASYVAGGSAEKGFGFVTVAKAGKAILPLTLLVTQTETPLALGVVSGTVGDTSPAVLYRNVWKDAAETLVPYIGYYTATLPGNGEYGSGYLTLTVDKAGKVKTAGKLADGTTVSQSGALILDGSGRVFAVVYASPAAYKGGCLFGLAEFVEPEESPVYMRLLDNVSFVWESRNPQGHWRIWLRFQPRTRTDRWLVQQDGKPVRLLSRRDFGSRHGRGCAGA